MTTRHVLAITLAAAVLVGCSTARQDRSAQAAASMGDLRKLLDRGAEQSAELVAATDKLSAAKPADIRKSYEQFIKGAQRLRSIAEDGKSLTTSMQKRSSVYLSKWEKEIASINDSELRQMSRERQASLDQEFRKLTASMADLGRTYNSFERNLSDIETFVGNDLTVAGRNMAKPALERLSADLLKVKATTRSAQDSLSQLETIFKPR
jgi:hypothetical protein